MLEVAQIAALKSLAVHMDPEQAGAIIAQAKTAMEGSQREFWRANRRRATAHLHFRDAIRRAYRCRRVLVRRRKPHLCRIPSKPTRRNRRVDRTSAGPIPSQPDSGCSAVRRWPCGLPRALQSQPMRATHSSVLAGIQAPAVEVRNHSGDIVGRVPAAKADELIAAGLVSPIAPQRHQVRGSEPRRTNLGAAVAGRQPHNRAYPQPVGHHHRRSEIWPSA